MSDSTPMGLVLTLAAAALAAAIVWALLALRKYLDSKAQVGIVWAAGARLAELAHAVVVEVVAGMGEDFRRALADGKVTPEERQALLTRALALAKAALAERGMTTLESAFKVAPTGAATIVSGAVAKAVDAELNRVTWTPAGHPQ